MAQLLRYDDASYLREATPEEHQQSIDTAKKDGGVGVILVNGERCYVPGDEEGVDFDLYYEDGPADKEGQMVEAVVKRIQGPMEQMHEELRASLQMMGEVLESIGRRVAILEGIACSESLQNKNLRGL